MNRRHFLSAMPLALAAPNFWRTPETFPPPKTLGDVKTYGRHLNAHGDYLMAEIVKAHLRYDPSFPRNEWQDLVKTYQVGTDTRWRRGRLTLEFDGNRVDAVVAPGGRTGAPAKVLLDGRRPSQFPELYKFTRVSHYPESRWPCLLRVSSAKPLILEEWTLTVREIPDDHKLVKFDVAGTKTGGDGAGTGEHKFVSDSGRVVLDPGDWNLEYSRSVFKRPVAPGFQIKWKVVPDFADEFMAPGASDPGVETVVTLAQGLSNVRHTLEIGGPKTPVGAIRVYRPPLR